MRVFFRKTGINFHIPRKYYAEWIKPIYPKSRHSIYGLTEKDLSLSINQKDADIFILPMTWNYYFEFGKLNEAIKIIREYEPYKKPILTWASGDYSLRVPDGNFLLLQHNLYRSKLKKNHYAYPAIIRDPIKSLNLYGIDLSPESSSFSISFCGVANKRCADKYLNSFREYLFMKKNKYLQPYLIVDTKISGMNLRGKILQSLHDYSSLKTNFIIRDKKDSAHMNKLEYKFQYWNNMLLSPFTLCIRGNGNFSVRLYETLAMGRIPVIIDTDCVFPLESQIQWRKHCIIINENIPKKAAKALEIAIRRMNKNDIFELQLMNRKLWFENLSFSGFYYSFTRYVFKNIYPRLSQVKF